MNTIEYNIDADDLAAFTTAHLRQTDQGRALVRRQMILIVGTVALSMTVIFLVERDITALLFAAVLCPVSIPLSRTITERSVRRNTLRLLAGDSSQRAFGDRRLTLTETDLVEESDTSTLRTALGHVGPIVETSTHLFIYVGPLEAHPVPRAKLKNGDLDGFVTTLRGRLE